MKRLVTSLCAVMLGMFQVTVAHARSDELIQREIEAQITGSEQLAGTAIAVHVENRLVILTGEVRIYEQKLVSERIAWTTTGVFEVDNEIRVMPKTPLTDTAIERKVMELVVSDDRFRAAAVTVSVSEGKVFLKGRFLGFSDPTALKHKVAEIEGVIEIDMHALFLAKLSGVNSSRYHRAVSSPALQTTASKGPEISIGRDRHPVTDKQKRPVSMLIVTPRK